jgi:4-amino-4-deoxy-L-arabinose transferase-like glycosyltransferase
MAMKQILIDKQKEIILAFLLSVWSIFILLLLLSLVKPVYIDEGVFLTIGKGIAYGKKMYLDFWDHKTPGIHYLWAAVFGLFGTNLIFYKVFIWIINFFTAGLVYLVGEKVKQGSGKFAAIILLASLVFFEGNYLSAGPFLAFFLTLAVWLLVKDRKNKYLIFFSGVSLALAFIFKQVAILNLPLFIIYFLVAKRFKDILIFLAGVLFPVAVMLLYFARADMLSEFWQQVFKSGENYPAESWNVRLDKWSETMGRIWWLWLGFGAGLAAIRKGQKEKWLILLMAVFPIFFFVRHYPHYWLQVAPFMAIVAGIGFVFVIEKYYKRHGIWLLVVFILIPVSLFQNFLWFKWTTDHLNEPRQKEQAEVVRLIDDLEGRKLLAENKFTGLYFLANKEPLTKYLYQTEVNEPQKARDTVFAELKKESNLVIVWPLDQKEVYSVEIGEWVIRNTQKLMEFPELDLGLYYKN